MSGNGYAGNVKALGFAGAAGALPTFQAEYAASWRRDNSAAEPYQKPGQTFSNFRIGAGYIHPASDNVTFDHFVINPGSYLYPLFIKTEPGNVPADGTTFSNGTVAFQHGSDTQGYRNYVGGNNTTLRNLDLSGTHDGLSITENVKNIVVDNVCVHDLAQHTTIAHNDGMEIYVGRNITLHNVILDNTQPDENQANSAINFTDEGGDIDNVLLDQVTLSTIKGCTIYLRGDGDGDVGNHRFDQTKVTNIRFRNVRIARWGTRDGRECRFSYYNAVGAITEWTNVTGPDGRLVPEPKSLCTDPQGHETPCAATQ